MVLLYVMFLPPLVEKNVACFGKKRFDHVKDNDISSIFIVASVNAYLNNNLLSYVFICLWMAW